MTKRYRFLILVLLLIPLTAAGADRKLGETCGILAGFAPCAAGLSCQPGVNKCFTVPRGDNEPCSAGFGCDVGMTCESGNQICVSVAKKVRGTFCDGVTHHCAEGLGCVMTISPLIPAFDVFPGLPHAGTGRCLDAGEYELDGTPFNDQAMWAADHPYSRTDSESNSIADKYEWATHNKCKPEELLVGVMVDTDHFNWMETVRGKQTNWTAVRNIIPVCVRTNNDLTWVGDPMEERNSADFTTGFTRLRCPQDTYVKRIFGTYTDALSPEANFLNSLQIECSNHTMTTMVGGFEPTTSSINLKTFNLECPSWRFLPIGTAFNKKDYGLGGAPQLKIIERSTRRCRHCTQSCSGLW